MKKWSTSNYLANKAKRLGTIKPGWVTNPETGSEFYLRRGSAMTAMLATYIHTVPSLADEVVAEWQKQGVAVGEPSLSLVTPERIAEGEKHLQLMTRVILDACVLPKLVAEAKSDDEMNLADLDDRDAVFIFRYGTGQIGGAASMAGLKSVPKKPGRRTRTRNSMPELRDAPESVAAAG